MTPERSPPRDHHAHLHTYAESWTGWLGGPVAEPRFGDGQKCAPQGGTGGWERESGASGAGGESCALPLRASGEARRERRRVVETGCDQQSPSVLS